VRRPRSPSRIIRVVRFERWARNQLEAAEQGLRRDDLFVERCRSSFLVKGDGPLRSSLEVAGHARLEHPIYWVAKGLLRREAQLVRER